MRTFDCTLHPLRVRFGRGMDGAVAEEAGRMGLSRLLVLSTPGQEGDARDLAASLGGKAAGVFAGAAMHTPVAVTEAAMAEAEGLNADGLVSIGGGSTTGLGKAMALRSGLPQIAVPTSYAGSEATPILGQTDGGRKTTLRDPRVLPDAIVYDVDRTMGLPAGMTTTSGLNAVAHAVAALQARDRSPISDMFAAAGLRAMIPALRALRDEPQDAEARSHALYGAWMCGTVLGQVTMSLHHKLAHVLGGSFDLPHAETHAILLPHSAAFNAPAVGDALAPLGEVLGGAPGPGLAALLSDLGAPAALRDVGMPEDGIDRAADQAMEQAYWNPRDLERGAIRDLIARAWEGAPHTA